MTSAEESKKAPRQRQQRSFDFSQHACRAIALRVAYLGWDYNGLACSGGDVVDAEFVETQHAAGNTAVRTVEGAVVAALVRARLIPGLKECGWSRCGRTDKGVSGYSQVFGLHVRSALKTPGLSNVWPGAAASRDDSSSAAGIPSPVVQASDSNDGAKSEIQYVQILNSLLPPTIRVLAWSPVSPTFNARFNCTSRRYNYTFSTLGLDIDAMRQACALLVGEHDFRCLCRVDKSNVPKSFVRRILECAIRDIDGGWAVLDVHGTGFLYNQIRCIFAILHMVGRGLEAPSVITSLLDVQEAERGRPVYQIADPQPLVLVDCTYPDGTFDWRTGAPDTLNLGGGSVTVKILESLHAQYLSLETRARQVRSLMERVTSGSKLLGSSEDAAVALDLALREPYDKHCSAMESALIAVAGERGGRAYVPLMSRNRCPVIPENQSGSKRRDRSDGVDDNDDGGVELASSKKRK